MNRFSIIVPMLGDRRLFDISLASVLRYRPDSSQIIVVVDGSYDDPYGLQGEVEFVRTGKGGKLIQMFNLAVSQAVGDYIALIRPGIELSEGWDELIGSKFEESHEIASVAPIVVVDNSPKIMVTAGVESGLGFKRRFVGARSKITPRTIRRIAPLGPTSWAAFFRRSSLEQIGNAAEQLDPLYLDLDIAMSLDAIGDTCAFCPECVVRVESSSLIEREMVLPHGKSAQRAYRRHAAILESNPSLLRTTCVIAAEIFMSVFQPWKLRHAIGRLGAWRMARIDRLYAERLLEVISERHKHDELPFFVPGIESESTRDSDSSHQAA